MQYNQVERCSVKVVLGMVAGKWKPLILYYLYAGPLRFVALWRLIPRVSKKVLLTQLRELEADGLVLRQQTGGYPPQVSYTLTPKGASLTRLLGCLQDWALEHQLEVHAQSVPAKPTEVAQ
jgi:DNA-binding HxlR family transcriptional regulator